MRTRSARRSLLALAGVTAGITSLAATGVPAAATPADPAPDAARGTWLSPDQKAQYTEPPAATLAALPDCTDFRDVLPKEPVDVWVPTTAAGDGNCQLGVGNQGNAVGKLQLAIHDCYPHLRGVMGPIDKKYGPDTRDAVIFVQAIEGVKQDGIYGPKTKNAMLWPGYRNGALFDCRPLIVP
jgi:peptidoglycan hydrolase-like protein with peptidoglycan-binding domain